MNPIAATVLRRLSWIYGLGTALRGRAFDHGWFESVDPGVYCVSVGGLEAGGVGKTPLVRELMRLAGEAGKRPAVLTRGFARSGREVGPVPRPIPSDAADRFGDEPSWLAAAGAGLSPPVDVWVGADRVANAAAARAGGADLLLLDDGFQHRRLRRDLDVVCLAGAAPLANRQLLPAGPLRESPRALRRADVFVLSQAEPSAAAAFSRGLAAELKLGQPVFSWSGAPRLRSVQGALPERGEDALVVTGIAHPERVAGALRRLDLGALEERAFPDHHRFTQRELGELCARARNRTIVTTEKDLVRLQRLDLGGLRLAVLELELRWHEPGAEAWFREQLRRAARRLTP